MYWCFIIIRKMKPHVTFKLDYKRDARNYWKAANSTPAWGYDFSKVVLPKIKEKVKGKSWDKSKDYLYSLLRKNYKRDGKMINLVNKHFSEAWNLIEDEYFKRLAKIMKKPIYTNKFTAYITTIKRYPYNEKEDSFMVGFWESTVSTLLTAAHEIMHLQFYKYYWKQCRKELDNDKTDDLKEAFTVLLNKEFLDLIVHRDDGYPKHQKLRQYLAKQWDKTHDFNEVLGKGISYLKKQG